MAALILMIGLALLITVRGIFMRNRLFEFPTLAAVLYLAYFVPQALAAERNSLLRGYEPWILWLYMSAALLMIVAGFAMGKRLALRKALRFPAPPMETQRLVAGALVLTTIGVLAIYRVQALAEAANAMGTSWTGEITAWYLLLDTLFYALAIGCLGFMRQRQNLILLLVALVSITFVLLMVNSNAKRGMIAEMVIILTGTWFFVKYRQPPRALVVVGLLLGTVLLHQVGVARDYVKQGRGTAIEAVLGGEMFSEFRYFNYQESPEIAQAMVDIYAVNQSGSIEGPVGLYNTIIHQYVPAFIFGREFKESLKLPENQLVMDDYYLTAFETTGATRTAFSNTYRAFGVGGLLVFLVIGFGFGWTYGYAINGRFWAQFYYLVLLNDGMIGLTESTDRLFVTVLFVVAVNFLIVTSSQIWFSDKRPRPFRQGAAEPFRGKFRPSVIQPSARQDASLSRT